MRRLAIGRSESFIFSKILGKISSILVKWLRQNEYWGSALSGLRKIIKTKRLVNALLGRNTQRHPEKRVALCICLYKKAVLRLFAGDICRRPSVRLFFPKSCAGRDVPVWAIRLLRDKLLFLFRYCSVRFLIVVVFFICFRANSCGLKLLRLHRNLSLFLPFNLRHLYSQHSFVHGGFCSGIIHFRRENNFF